MRINRALLDADLILSVTAAETSERGGACALLGACSAEAIASAGPAPVPAGAVPLADRHPRRRGRCGPRSPHSRDGALARARPSAADRPLSRLPLVAVSRWTRSRARRFGRLANLMPGDARARSPGADGSGAHRRRRPRRPTRRLPCRGAASRRLPARSHASPSSWTRSSCRSRGSRSTLRGSR